MEHLSTDKAALTVPEFCRLYSLSRPTAYRLMALRLGVQIEKSGRSLVIEAEIFDGSGVLVHEAGVVGDAFRSLDLCGVERLGFGSFRGWLSGGSGWWRAEQRSWLRLAAQR